MLSLTRMFRTLSFFNFNSSAFVAVVAVFGSFHGFSHTLKFTCTQTQCLMFRSLYSYWAFGLEKPPQHQTAPVLLSFVGVHVQSNSSSANARFLLHALQLVAQNAFKNSESEKFFALASQGCVTHTFSVLVSLQIISYLSPLIICFPSRHYSILERHSTHALP